MISELDIWRAANLLIGRHGAAAELEAACLQERGDSLAVTVGAPSDPGKLGRQRGDEAVL